MALLAFPTWRVSAGFPGGGEPRPRAPPLPSPTPASPRAPRDRQGTLARGRHVTAELSHAPRLLLLPDPPATLVSCYVIVSFFFFFFLIYFYFNTEPSASGLNLQTRGQVKSRVSSLVWTDSLIWRSRDSVGFLRKPQGTRGAVIARARGGPDLSSRVMGGLAGRPRLSGRSHRAAQTGGACFSWFWRLRIQGQGAGRFRVWRELASGFVGGVFSLFLWGLFGKGTNLIREGSTLVT